MKILKLLTTAAVIALAAAVVGAATPNPLAWQNKKLSPDARADLLVRAMTLDEKLLVVTSYYGTQFDWNEYRNPLARRQSAGFASINPPYEFRAASMSAEVRRQALSRLATTSRMKRS